MAAVSSEINALETLYQASQARLGITAAYIAMIEWDTVSAINYIGTSAAWVTRAIRVIAAIRRKSRDLAVSYYQLSRGLQTGESLGAPEGAPGGAKETTLGDLRKVFLDNVQEIADLGTGKVTSDDPDLRWLQRQVHDRQVEALDEFRTVSLSDTDLSDSIKDFKRNRSTNDNTKITVEKFQWPDAWTSQEVDEAFRDLLRKQAVEKANKAALAIRKNSSLTPEEVITQLDDAHEKSGSTASGIVDQAATQAANDVIDFAVEKDKRAKRWARKTSGDPCAFCAMLASRGFVYRSEASAGFKAHPNCHCTAVVRFDTSTQLPELNAYFKSQWPIVTKGYSGNDALNAWRRWIYRQRKKNGTSGLEVAQVA
jgi:hypothetical protein